MNLRNTASFVWSLLLVFLIVLNAYVVGNYRDARCLFGMSDAQFTGRYQSLVLALTVALLALTLATKKRNVKPEPREGVQIDAAFLLRSTALLANYRALAVVSFEYHDPAARLVVPSILLVLGLCVFALLCRNAPADDRMYLLCWAQLCLVALILVVALGAELPVVVLRSCFRHENLNVNDFVLNPPIGAAFLVVPHFIVSFTNPSRRRSTRMRLQDVAVYVAFTAVIALYVPRTMQAVRSLESVRDPRPYKLALVVAYCALFFIAFEWLRPETFAGGWRQVMRDVARHCAILTAAATAVGAAIAYRTAPPLRVPVLIGHAFVGLNVGLVLPAYYAAYERWLLPWLRQRVDTT